MAEPVLTTKERNDLVNFLVNLPDFAGGTWGRLGLVNKAGLSRFAGDIPWDAPAKIAASAFVDILNAYGTLRRDPKDPATATSYHAVGKLAVYLLDGASEEDAKFLATIIVRHNLVRDPAYCENLRSEYHLTNMVAPGLAGPADSLPALTNNSAEPPTFTPIIQDASGLEQVLHSEDNFLDVYALLSAFYCGQAVGLVEAPLGQAKGTGWLIAHDLLLTNAHVLPDREWAAEAVVRFGYMNDTAGVRVPHEHVVRVDPTFYYSSPPKKLDYALVRLKEAPLRSKRPEGDTSQLPILDLIRQDKHRGYLVVAPRNLRNLMRVNIIQHPGGSPLKVVLTQNYINNDAKDGRVQYNADTKDGSSGSPVFNTLWEVVALHHSGTPYPPLPGDALKDPNLRPKINEGIPMKDILNDFSNRRDEGGRPLIDYIPQAG